VTTNTAQAIIEKAYTDSMKLSRGGTLTSAQLAEGLDRLQDIVNVEATLGLKLFLETEVSVTLVSGQQLYSFRPSGNVNVPRPLRIKEATYVGSTGQSRPLIALSRSDWAQQPNRASVGTVTQYFTERLYDRLNLYLWNTPDAMAAAGTVRATLHTPASTLTLSTTTAFPPEWVMFLRWALAADLASGMPAEIIQRAEGKAAQFRSILESFDVEDVPTRFQATYPQHSPSGFQS
jgi:hypothetical protein